MKDLSVYIYEANGYSAILTTINEWIYMSHKAHDTILYCAIGRDDEDKDGYILRVNIAEKPYQIDAFHLSEAQLTQLYRSATNDHYRKFSIFENGKFIQIYMGADLVVECPNHKIDVDKLEPERLQKYINIFNESKYTIHSKRVKQILIREFEKLGSY